MMEDLDIEIRKLRPGDSVKLSRILECGDGWKQLMSIIPAEGSTDKLKYSGEQIKIVECNGKKSGRMCAEILLDEWGTSGRVRPRLSTLVDLLTQAQLFRAADFVATLLKRNLPERPVDGPAAFVEIPNVDEEVSGPMKVPPPSPDIAPRPPPLVPSAPPLTIHMPSAPPPSIISNLTFYSDTAADLIPPVRPPRMSKSRSPVPIIETPPTTESIHNNQLDETALVISGNNTLVDIVTGSIPEYKYMELELGTRGFSKELLLGGGAFGEVYLCYINEDKVDVDLLKMVKGNRTAKRVAVKRLFETAPGGSDPVDLLKTEVKHLATISHPNLLSLLGYSLDGKTPCLIYDYMPNGSLQDRIECKGGSKVLTWKMRLNIAIGSCEGLLHLHTCVHPQNGKALVHRDVKSANILLDQDMIPKVGDFGLVRHGASAQHTMTVSMTTTVVGTSAYMAPEAFRGDISVKMDVFSFGVVLLELITGLPPYDPERDGVDLASHVDEADSIDELIDKKLGYQDSAVPYELFEISKLCLLEKKKRPFMDKILELLRSVPPPKHTSSLKKKINK